MKRPKPPGTKFLVQPSSKGLHTQGTPTGKPYGRQGVSPAGSLQARPVEDRGLHLLQSQAPQFLSLGCPAESAANRGLGIARVSLSATQSVKAHLAMVKAVLFMHLESKHLCCRDPGKTNGTCCICSKEPPVDPVKRMRDQERMHLSKHASSFRLPPVLPGLPTSDVAQPNGTPLPEPNRSSTFPWWTPFQKHCLPSRNDTHPAHPSPPAPSPGVPATLSALGEWPAPVSPGSPLDLGDADRICARGSFLSILPQKYHSFQTIQKPVVFYGRCLKE